MRWSSKGHEAYCGIDLHGRSMYVCLFNRDGEMLLHRNIPTRPEIFLKAIAPHRQDLVVADEQWAIIELLIPKTRRKRGRPRNDERRTLNGLLSVLKTGCTWEDLLREYGSDSTCSQRLDEWARDGTWERIWRAFLSQLDADSKLEWAPAFSEGSFVPATKGGME